MAGKAFLSHSVADKHIVRQVFRILGSRLAEIDETTFEGGLPNWQVIVRALERSELFVLFATKSALDSRWVLKEVKEAHRRLKDSKLKRMLIFTLGDIPLEDMPSSLRTFAIFLSLTRPSTIARAIQRHLLELDSLSRGSEEDFVGRDKELADLKNSILDPSAERIGISVSGLALLGRTAIISRCLRDLYPSMYLPEKVINFEVFKSCADLALELHGSVDSFITPEEISTIRETFRSDDVSSCGQRLAHSINELYSEHQYVIFSDRGGIINHRGEFSNIARSMVKSFGRGHDLCLFFITQRRPVAKARSECDTLVFLDIDPLDPDSARQYIVQKARIRGVSLSPPEIDDIIKLGHGHPQNYDFILEKCKQYTASVALADLEDIYAVSRERSRAILESIRFSRNARHLLSVLRLYFNIPAEFIADLFEDAVEGADACAELLDLHVIMESHGVYSISPPLVDAIGRDRRLALDPAQSARIARKFVKALNEYQDDGRVPVNIIDAAALAALESGAERSNWTEQFILPSHYIYLARHLYHRRQYERAIEYAESAIHYKLSLTDAAFIQACRTLGMSAAQIGDDERVRRATGFLTALRDSYANASAHFIRGFNARLSGDFKTAEEEYLAAKPTARDDIALDRELATVYLLLRDYERALSYADLALARAPDSPYLLDSVARALINKYESEQSLEEELRLADVMRRLEHADAEHQGSFFALRQAEHLLRRHEVARALSFADEAVRRTPELAAPYLMRSRIHLAKGAIRSARSDRDAAKLRSHRSKRKQTHYDAELLRVEIDIALKTRRWRDAISACETLRSFGIRDINEISRRIGHGILRDKTITDQEVVSFARRVA